jgi:hypothetical protein
MMHWENAILPRFENPDLGHLAGLAELFQFQNAIFAKCLDLAVFVSSRVPHP